MVASRFERISNPVMTFLVGRLGLNFQGAEVLTVRGRTSGRMRSVVINPFRFEGETYLLSGRAEVPQWMKNVRAAGSGTLWRGRHVSAFRVQEVTTEEKVPVMRA